MGDREQVTSDEHDIDKLQALVQRYGRALELVAFADFEMRVSEANALMRRIARDALNGKETFDGTGRVVSTRLVKRGNKVGIPT